LSLLPSRRPLNPPLLPYTTLFRSFGAVPVQDGLHLVLPPVLRRLHLCRQMVRAQLPLDAERAFGVRAGDRAAQHPLGGGDEPQRDRKSTRLNSSHVKISYAVFCLK